MKVLISGGTGFIGQRLVKELNRKGHSVRLLSRRGADAQKRFAFPVEFAKWDAETTDLSPEALVGIQGVIHLAGEGIADKRWSEDRKKKILDSRVIGTERLVKAVAAAPVPVQTFIGASAIGFYGDRGDAILSEDSQPGDGFLSTVCQEWENASEGLPKTVRKCTVRIGIVLGEGGGALKPLLPLFKLGLGGPVGTGKQWMSWIHVDDLVALFIHLLENPSASGVFNGVTNKPVTNKEFTKALARAVHRPALFPAPAIALKLALGEMSTLVLGSQKVTPKRTSQTGFKCRFETIDAAFEDIVKKKAD